MHARWIVTSILAGVVVFGPSGVEAKHLSFLKHDRAPDELVFNADDGGVKPSVHIPAEIAPVLTSDEYVQSLLDERKISPSKLPSSWFSASHVQLGGKESDDLIVVGQAPVAGANVSPFWIFCATPQGYRLALKLSTHTLIVKSTRWNGRREIETVAATASEVFTVSYRFDGQQYNSYQEKASPIP
jgi:hypothetical protein